MCRTEQPTLPAWGGQRIAAPTWQPWVSVWASTCCAPPAHSATLLASAQTLWFSSADGRQHGWEAIASAQEAQSRANAGALVVISYASPNPRKPGHIAIVRPSLKTQEQLEAEGPQIAQAGFTNSPDWSTRQGFSHHPDAWPHGVRYFAHALPTP